MLAEAPPRTPEILRFGAASRLGIIPLDRQPHHESCLAVAVEIHAERSPSPRSLKLLAAPKRKISGFRAEPEGHRLRSGFLISLQICVGWAYSPTIASRQVRVVVAQCPAARNGGPGRVPAANPARGAGSTGGRVLRDFMD